MYDQHRVSRMNKIHLWISMVDKDCSTHSDHCFLIKSWFLGFGSQQQKPAQYRCILRQFTQQSIPLELLQVVRVLTLQDRFYTIRSHCSNFPWHLSPHDADYITLCCRILQSFSCNGFFALSGYSFPQMLAVRSEDKGLGLFIANMNLTEGVNYIHLSLT